MHTRSRRVEMPSGLSLPLAFGIYTRLIGSGRYAGWDFQPTGKRRLFTAHPVSGHSQPRRRPDCVRYCWSKRRASRRQFHLTQERMVARISFEVIQERIAFDITEKWVVGFVCLLEVIQSAI